MQAPGGIRPVSGRACVRAGHTGVPVGISPLGGGAESQGPRCRPPQGQMRTIQKELDLRGPNAVRARGQMRTNQRGLNLRGPNAVPLRGQMRTNQRGLNLRGPNTVPLRGQMRTNQRGLNLRGPGAVRSRRPPPVQETSTAVWPAPPCARPEAGRLPPPLPVRKRSSALPLLAPQHGHCFTPAHARPEAHEEMTPTLRAVATPRSGAVSGSVTRCCKWPRRSARHRQNLHGR